MASLVPIIRERQEIVNPSIFEQLSLRGLAFRNNTMSWQIEIKPTAEKQYLKLDRKDKNED